MLKELSCTLGLTRPLTLAVAFSLSLLGGCAEEAEMNTPPPQPVSPVESVPLSETVMAAGLSAPVDVVRDELGVPHFYARSFADAAFAQGYFMAADRLVMMDLIRRNAEGTLAELLGELRSELIDADINMRVHHIAATARESLAALRSSQSPRDQQLVAALDRFAAGVNLFITEAQAGKHKLPAVLSLVYDVKGTRPWQPEDSVELALFQAFDLSFDADSEITFSLIDEAGAAKFDGSPDPLRAARKGIAADLQLLSPVDPTYTIDSGWTGMPQKTAAASLPSARRVRGPRDPLALQRTLRTRRAVEGLGDDRVLKPALGSNNWVVGPGLSATGAPMLANDTHLLLSNPPVFYMQHVKVQNAEREDNVMGVQFAGIPGVVLGMNQHVAWGSTVSMVDVTDVYRETLTPCDVGPGPCVMWKGQKVALRPRKEVIAIGRFGKISERREITLYDVPHHGPILPRLTGDHALEPLAATELSIRYTGYEPVQILRAVWGVNLARSVAEATTALERDFLVGRQNWVLIDDQGHFGWTQATRVPRRAPGFAPWKILPGDGSAEWRGDLPMQYLPHAVDPAQGYLVTANADPIGVTADNDPFFSEPMVDGSPLYLGADYDTGTRVGRATKRIEAKKRASQKLTLRDMADIQGDHVTEYGELLTPTLLAAVQALNHEILRPGAYPELSPLVAAATAQQKAIVPMVLGWLPAWSFRTPAGVPLSPDDVPSSDDIADSRATLVFAMWMSQLDKLALGDELKVLGVSPGSDFRTKLLIRMCQKPELLKTGVHARTGDAVLFDDMATPEIESKLYIAAKALLTGLEVLIPRLGADADKWRWGQVHKLTLGFPAGLDSLNLPSRDEPDFAGGFPRPGANGTVDVGPHGLSTTRFSFGFGAAMRFVCEMTPSGPRARNALPGGQIFDPDSPHYRDQLELWRRNRTFDLPFRDDEVQSSAAREQAMHGIGRTRFVPTR